MKYLEGKSIQFRFTVNTVYKKFTIIELLVVIGIIMLLAAMLFPVLKKSRDRAKRIACMNNLKQCGLALFNYKDDNDYKYVYWTSWLYPNYLKNTEVLRCPVDGNENGTPASQWNARIDEDHSGAYDRIGNTGLNVDPNPDAGNISYFYEFNDSQPTWIAQTVSFAEYKEFQLKYGDDYSNPDSTKGYEPTLFPVLRCFWHLDHLERYSPSNRIPLLEKPVLNISYAGNLFYTRHKWEDGAWSF